VKEKVKRLQEIREEINKLYAEKGKIEQEVIDQLVEQGDKVYELNDSEFIALKWVFDKKIDYERMKAIYPEIYEQGLITSFSTNRALMSVDKKLFTMILDDCTTIDPHYELEYKKNYKRKPLQVKRRN